jgi:hypothetical protein
MADVGCPLAGNVARERATYINPLNPYFTPAPFNVPSIHAA